MQTAVCAGTLLTTRNSDCARARENERASTNGRNELASQLLTSSGCRCVRQFSTLVKEDEDSYESLMSSGGSGARKGGRKRKQPTDGADGVAAGNGATTPGTPVALDGAAAIAAISNARRKRRKLGQELDSYDDEGDEDDDEAVTVTTDLVDNDGGLALVVEEPPELGVSSFAHDDDDVTAGTGIIASAIGADDDANDPDYDDNE